MRRRHLSIRARTTVAQRLPADYQERVAIYRTYCHDKITTPSHITNMDEISLTFNIPLTHKWRKRDQHGGDTHNGAQKVVFHRRSRLLRKRTER
ncbi:hypothetical protein D4764_12G0010460 [Takifugu flavidus]|uniref:Uncharacterized protein n=1 Tax=Takifugu flavidus TaxID=433684 RepID=A0A5C6PEU3_9TELE|nr:hypothetical protein D4764_12G0010460 [Takifugu flavidus]